MQLFSIWQTAAVTRQLRLAVMSNLLSSPDVLGLSFVDTAVTVLWPICLVSYKCSIPVTIIWAACNRGTCITDMTTGCSSRRRLKQLLLMSVIIWKCWQSSVSKAAATTSVAGWSTTSTDGKMPASDWESFCDQQMAEGVTESHPNGMECRNG